MASMNSRELAEKIKRRIRELRISQGLSEAQLSARAGLTEEKLILIEQGERLPSLETIQSLASALGVQMSDLM